MKIKKIGIVGSGYIGGTLGMLLAKNRIRGVL